MKKQYSRILWFCDCLEVNRKMATLAYVGYILALVGGIIVILFGLIGLLFTPFLLFSPLGFLTGFVSSLVTIVIGIVCIIGSRYVTTWVWAIILLILGLITWSSGGVLVVLGALLGIVSTLVKNPP